MDIILNTVVLIFLCLAISYCWLLNKKIQEIKNTKDDMQNYLIKLDNSINTTSKNIEILKNMSDETASKLTKINKKSEELADDLSFINERSKSLINDMKKSLAQNKTETKNKK